MDQEDERVLYNIQNGTRMVSMLLLQMPEWHYGYIRCYPECMIRSC